MLDSSRTNIAFIELQEQGKKWTRYVRSCCMWAETLTLSNKATKKSLAVNMYSPLLAHAHLSGMAQCHT